MRLPVPGIRLAWEGEHAFRIECCERRRGATDALQETTPVYIADAFHCAPPTFTGEPEDAPSEPEDALKIFGEMSPQRVSLLRHLGAELVFTSGVLTCDAVMPVEQPVREIPDAIRHCRTVDVYSPVIGKISDVL